MQHSVVAWGCSPGARGGIRSAPWHRKRGSAELPVLPVSLQPRPPQHGVRMLGWGPGCSPCPSHAVTAHVYFMANNGILLSIPLPDFFPPCYVFRLNKCKSLGSFQLPGKELSRVRWLCPAVGGRHWCKLQLQVAWCKSQSWQIVSVNPSRAPSACCSLTRHLRPAVVPTSASGLWLRGTGPRMGSAALALPVALHAGGHPLGTTSIPSQGGGEQISPNILLTVPIC